MAASRIARAAQRSAFNSSRSVVSRTTHASAKKLLAVGSTATAVAFTLPMFTWNPFGSSNNNNSQGFPGSSNGDVPVDIENTRRPATADQAHSSSMGAGGKRSELDDLLDAIFGTDSSKFDPIEQIQRNVPRYLWPSFLEDIVDERQRTGRSRYDRYRESGSAASAAGSDDITGKLVGFLQDLAPQHAGWWEWASELSRPFHLSLEDRGNEYSMRVMTKGLGKDEVKVRVNNGILTVAGIKTVSQRSGDDANYAAQSSAAQHFQQSIRLPTDADIGHIRAKFVNGGLDVVIPKKHNSWRGGDIRVE